MDVRSGEVALDLTPFATCSVPSTCDLQDHGTAAFSDGFYAPAQDQCGMGFYGGHWDSGASAHCVPSYGAHPAAYGSMAMHPGYAAMHAVPTAAHVCTSAVDADCDAADQDLSTIFSYDSDDDVLEALVPEMVKEEPHEAQAQGPQHTLSRSSSASDAGVVPDLTSSAAGVGQQLLGHMLQNMPDGFTQVRLRA